MPAINLEEPQQVQADGLFKDALFMLQVRPKDENETPNDSESTVFADMMPAHSVVVQDSRGGMAAKRPSRVQLLCKKGVSIALFSHTLLAERVVDAFIAERDRYIHDPRDRAHALRALLKQYNDEGHAFSLACFDESARAFFAWTPRSAPLSFGHAEDGSVVVVDTCNARIRKISPEGLVSTLAGSGEEGFKDGAAAEAQFNYPGGVAFDGEGNLFVIDPANARIRKVSPDGQVSTLAGCGLAGFNDGPAAEAEFKFPQSVAVDGDGCLVIVDLGNHRIRKISPDGRVRTLAGTGVEGFADGAVAEAKFAYPQDVAVASDGSLFVADLGNQRIRKISLDGMVSTYAGEGDPLPPEAERERRASLRVRRLSWAALPTPA